MGLTQSKTAQEPGAKQEKEQASFPLSFLGKIWSMVQSTANEQTKDDVAEKLAEEKAKQEEARVKALIARAEKKLHEDQSPLEVLKRLFSRAIRPKQDESNATAFASLLTPEEPSQPVKDSFPAPKVSIEEQERMYRYHLIAFAAAVADKTNNLAVAQHAAIALNPHLAHIGISPKKPRLESPVKVSQARGTIFTPQSVSGVTSARQDQAIENSSENIPRIRRLSR